MAVVSFENDLCKITRNSKLLAVGVIRGKLYVLKTMEDKGADVQKPVSLILG